MNIKTEFKTEFVTFLNGVNNSTLLKSYDLAKDIVLSYKVKGIKKEDVVKVFLEIQDMELNNYQEEIIIDMANRIDGQCPPDRRINL